LDEARQHLLAIGREPANAELDPGAAVRVCWICPRLEHDPDAAQRRRVVRELDRERGLEPDRSRREGRDEQRLGIAEALERRDELIDRRAPRRDPQTFGGGGLSQPSSDCKYDRPRSRWAQTSQLYDTVVRVEIAAPVGKI